MKKTLNLWPFLVSIVMAWPLNVDWSILPSLKGFSALSNFQIFLIGSILATGELLYWYWFWRWFGRFLANRENIKMTIAFGKDIVFDLKEDGYLDRLITHFQKTFCWAVDPKRVYMKIIKASGYVGLFLLGIEPIVPGGRVAGVIFCGTLGSKKGLVVLAAGNVLHIAYMVGIWNMVFKIFG